MSDFRQDRAEDNFDLASNVLRGLFPKPLKRLMREIQKIAIVPNVPKSNEDWLRKFARRPLRSRETLVGPSGRF
jgi:hypothetical protein